MTKNKYRQIGNKRKKDYRPCYRKYYTSRKYKELLGATRQRVLLLRKNVLGY